jgi:hypothetical protein
LRHAFNIIEREHQVVAQRVSRFLRVALCAHASRPQTGGGAAARRAATSSGMERGRR